ncbi:MBG domain-containing protein [Janthinobacterium sp. 78]|uniref:MBG domain-containing protein n=1 Tax=Janthinobacterium sp. 78 TaxID=2135631 RepID=UPI000D5FB866|nr:MBG domain-containing protein [Janthinobacterium sp. 78]PVX35498.1 filamentous hemagglutinin family protein [Janthinobacterium sp. 78]
MHRHGSLNHIYRLVWSHVLNAWVAVAETSRGRGKGGRRKLAAAAAAMAALTLGGPACAGPTGGQVVAGSATITQSGATTTIQQTSQQASLNWASFNVGSKETVNFVQPSASALAVNRILDSNGSQILGRLNANGQVYLINPNGILFGRTAQVNVGALVASTLDIDTASLAGNKHVFSGKGGGRIVNEGTIRAADGGYVALVSAKISNSGSIAAHAGSVLMGAGSAVTLDLGGPVKLQVTQGALDTLIENGGAIRADGGQVYLTAKAAGELAASVINNTGVIEAHTLASGEKGQIVLLGDMKKGNLHVAGVLDASAPQGGDGGFIETSANRVDIGAARVTTAAPRGKTGTWLIDPNDFTVAASGGNMTGADVSNALASNNFSIMTTSMGTTGGRGDIYVNDAVNWSANKLTLTAERNININANLNATGTASLAYQYGQATADGVGSGYQVAAGVAVNIPVASAFTWQKGRAGTVQNLVLDNGKVRFGYGQEDSFTTEGLLKTPYYFDNTTPGRNGWFALTYGNPLEFAVAAGGIGANAWNINGQILISNGMGGGFPGMGGDFPGMNMGGSYSAALSNRSLNIAGYKEGVGTVVTTGTLHFSSLNQSASIAHTYTLKAGEPFVNMDSRLTNLSTTPLTNVRMWLGTGDDFIGESDENYKIKGNVVSGAFVPLTNGTSASNAIMVTETNSTTSGSAILFYSTTAGVDTVHTSCCEFINSVSMNPRSTAVASGQTDGSYAMFLRVADLAPGQSGGLSVYYAAAPVAQLKDAIVTVDNAAGNASKPVYVRLTPGTSLYGDVPVFNYALYDALSGGTLVADASASGTVSWLGAPTATSSAGVYTISYNTGLVLGKTGYTLTPGGPVYWTVTPRPLNVAVTKTYDGSGTFNSGFVLSGLVNGDSAPSVSGSATVGSRNAGRYSSFDSSTLSLSNSNYVLNASGISASIDPRPIMVAADAKSKVYGNVDPSLTYQVTKGALVEGDSLGGVLRRVAGENVGSYTIDASALANGNYVVTAHDGVLSIAARPITVTADAKSKVYGNVDPGLTYQVTQGSLVAGDSLNGILRRAAGENVGSYTIDASALANGNYVVTAHDGALSIDARPITVTADAKSKVYGNVDPGLTYQVTQGSLVAGDSLGGVLRRAAGENVGSYTIDASALANGNYVVTAHDGALSIAARPITVTADAKSKVYGNVDPGLTYQVTQGSLVAGDSLNGILRRAAGENVGSYTIDASALANGNYVVTAHDGALSIAARPITVTADAKSKVYGNVDPSLTYQVTQGSLVAGDSLGGVLRRVAGENVGSYRIDASALANGNYVVTAHDGALSIAARPITVTADAKSKVYGNVDPGLTYQVTQGSLMAGDSLGGILRRAAGENVGSYTIDASALANGNYVVTAHNGALSIAARPITVTADAKSKVYGNVDPGLTYQVTQGTLVAGDSLSGVLRRAAGENVGSYTIDASALANGNYVVTAHDGALSIAARPITVTADAKSKVYGNVDPGLTYQVTQGSLVAGDSLSGVLRRVAGENVGSYTIDASALANGNYVVTAHDGALSIAARPITVTADAKSKVYGNVDPGLTYQVTQGTLVAGDSLGGILRRAAGENVGSYTIDASALANGNYVVTAHNGALSIAARPITVTADAKSKVYGNVDPGLTYQVTQGTLVAGDSLSGALRRAAGENVGSYTIDASALANGNYVVTAHDGALSIAARPITVTADAKSKVYGNVDPGLTYQVTQGSLVAGDSLNGILRRAAGENVGSYTIDASALANGNYVVTAHDGALSIAARPITVTADAKSKVYGNVDPGLTYQVTQGSLVAGDSLGGVLRRAVGENVGSYTIDASALANGNYVVTAHDGALSIAARPITVTADAKSKVYGNVDPGLTYQVTQGTLVAGDSLGGILRRAAGENVGSYTIDASALANGNYVVTAHNGALSIAARPITVTADAKSKVYGNVDPGLTYQVTQGTLVAGDSLSGVLRRAAGENVGSYTIDASALANGNYVVTAHDGALSIAARPITVTADAKSKVYGNVDPGLTYQVTQGSLVAGDSLSGALRRAAGENVGSYTIDASALANGNYVVTARNGALSIAADPALENAIRLARRQVTTGTNDVAAGTVANAGALAIPGVAANAVPGAGSMPDNGVNLIGGLALVPVTDAAHATPAQGGSGTPGFTRIFVVNGGINVLAAAPVDGGVAQ